MPFIGGFFLIFGLAFSWYSFSARRYWTETQGLVSKLDFEKGGIEYEYSVNGQQYTGSSGDDPNWNRIGKTVRVYYDENNPSKSKHHNWFNEIVFGWTFTAIGMGLISILWIV